MAGHNPGWTMRRLRRPRVGAGAARSRGLQRGGAGLALVLLAAVAMPVSMPDCFAQPAPPAAAAQGPAIVRDATVIEGVDGVRVEVEFAYDPRAWSMSVRYRLRNPDAAPPLAVFDRGDRHQVATGRLALGAIAPPGQVESAEAGKAGAPASGADIELLHAALPLPDPAPTSPPVPLAVRVAPGAVLEGAFTVPLLSQQAPRRVRWCLGATPFAPEAFDAPAKTAEGEVWSAPLSVAHAQRMLCTDWFDTGQGRFLPGQHAPASPRAPAAAGPRRPALRGH